MKKILSFVLALCLLCSAMLCVSANDEQYKPKKMKYADTVLAKYDIDINSDDFSWEDYFYEELFYYHGNKNDTSLDTSTPDYVLIFTDSCFLVDAIESKYFGSYIVSGAKEMWGTCGYHIYFPAEDRLCSLEEAYNAGVSGIDETILFREDIPWGSIYIFGDVDNNRVLNVKDATFIQKCISEILKFPGYDFVDSSVYISDFNRDGERNVKDATAIQKHIAGLEY